MSTNNKIDNIVWYIHTVNTLNNDKRNKLLLSKFMLFE